ncbi:hypothetical protein KCU62_g380, partial [Aureobasidium sp. EXF-3399]
MGDEVEGCRTKCSCAGSFDLLSQMLLRRMEFPSLDIRDGYRGRPLDPRTSFFADLGQCISDSKDLADILECHFLEQNVLGAKHPGFLFGVEGFGRYRRSPEWHRWSLFHTLYTLDAGSCTVGRRGVMDCALPTPLYPSIAIYH